jgi:hypothetical protein
MAKLKFGMIVTEGRNKIGGHVLSRNRAGAYARTKVTPTNPQTSFQVNVRASIASLASGWRALATGKREAWNAAVKDYVKTDIFGDKMTPSGFNLYMMLNQNLYNVDVAAITDPPLPTNVASFTTMTVAIAKGAGTAVATVAPTIDAAESVIMFATPGISAGKFYVKSDFRKIGVFTTGVSLDFATMYTTKFGAIPVAGLKVFVKCVHINETTGQAGQANIASTVVVA